MKPVTLPLFRRIAPPVSTTPEIDALVASAAPVAIGVSGGKDSTAAAFATIEHLDRVGHAGPRVLIHSDLGVTEWPQSLEWCHKLSDRLGVELLVVRRAKGDMMDRWEQRWADNVARYAILKCVQLILPWSTPDMRFCTSEMKVAPICADLVRRFPGKTILSVTGIRRQESEGRKNAPITKPQPKLTSKTRGTTGIDWHPIPDWSLEEVFSIHRDRDFPLHPAYTEWGLGRVSCMDCIMQSDADSKAVALYPGSHALHRRIAKLEISSTFGFQRNRWRADYALGLLSDLEREQLAFAKRRGAEREAAEKRIPKHLLFTKGWPHCVPTRSEAELLCGVRRTVAAAVGLSIDFTEPDALINRYRELMAEKGAA